MSRVPPNFFLTKKAPLFCVQNHHFMLFLIVNVNPFWSIFHIFAAETPVFPRLCEIDLWLPLLFLKKMGRISPNSVAFLSKFRNIVFYFHSTFCSIVPVVMIIHTPSPPSPFHVFLFPLFLSLSLSMSIFIQGHELGVRYWGAYRGN